MQLDVNIEHVELDLAHFGALAEVLCMVLGHVCLITKVYIFVLIQGFWAWIWPSHNMLRDNGGGGIRNDSWIGPDPKFQ